LNATSGGSAQQVKHLVSQGCIRPFCELLTVADPKIISVAIEGLENILKVGDSEAKQIGGETNQMATFVDEAEGLDKIERLRQHENHGICEKATKILGEYFSVEDADEEKDEEQEQLQEDNKVASKPAPLTTNAPTTTTPARTVGDSSPPSEVIYRDQLRQLAGMGFYDTERLARMLDAEKGDVQHVVERLF
jgi:hypothetical protein